MAYYSDFETEPIGGSNPYSRCIHCKRSVPEINGRFDRHEADCKYRQSMEQGVPYRPFSDAIVEPTTREEIEAILKAKIEANEAETGLYDTGLSFVVVDRVEGEFTFRWFDSPMLLDDVLSA